MCYSAGEIACNKNETKSKERMEKEAIHNETLWSL
jgi:hypothetical protein